MDDKASVAAATAAPTGALDRYFGLSTRATSLPQEMIAGATTFASMAYIIAVNPSIMSNAGMDRGDLVMATALAAIFGSVMMGLWANLPLAVAPAMGSNVIFTYVVVKQMNAPWQGALAMVAFTGVVFLILSLTKLREKVAKEVPEALKIGIQAAVGTLIVFIGLRGAGFIVSNPSTYIAMGSLKNPAVLLTMVGLLLTPILVVRQVPGALIIVHRRHHHRRLFRAGGRRQDGHDAAIGADRLAEMAGEHVRAARFQMAVFQFLHHAAAVVLFPVRGILLDARHADRRHRRRQSSKTRRLDSERHRRLRNRRHREHRRPGARHLGRDSLYRIDHRRAGRRAHRPDLDHGRGAVLPGAVHLADLRDRAARRPPRRRWCWSAC